MIRHSLANCNLVFSHESVSIPSLIVLGLVALRLLLEQVAKTFFFGQFLSSEHITSRWPHKWKRDWGLLTVYNFFNNIFVWATQAAYVVPQSFLKARHPLDFITAAPAEVFFDNLETEERISSLNLNITWVMRAAVMLQEKFKIQNYFWQSIFDFFSF